MAHRALHEDLRPKLPLASGFAVAAIATVLLGGACSETRGSAPPSRTGSAAPSIPEPATPPSAPSATRADAGALPLGTASDVSAFASLRDRVLDELLADDPATARELGLHEYDGKVAAASMTALAARLERLRAAGDALAAVDPASLAADAALDRAELASWVSSSLFTLVDMDAPRKSPRFYEPLFDVSSYIDHESSSIEDRAARLVDHEEAALAEAPHVRENLAPPLSRPVTEVAARNFAGFATYLRGDVTKIMGRVGDEAQRARFAKANEALAKIATSLSNWLKKEAARGDQSHVLGPMRYAKLLRVQEGLSLPIDEFERMNEVDLATNKKAYEELAARGDAAQPRPLVEEQLFATARRIMEGARAFVVEHAIVTLPSTDEPGVRETPPYERWNSASIEMSGPFDSARSAFYQLTIPDRSWAPSARAAYLGSFGDLLGTTIHEVYPGHFVQGRWVERAGTRVAKAFASYSFVEGWAHYAEQMMIDEGFGADDPSNRLAMLHGALLRNCRFAASVGIHVRGMTVEQAERRFVTDCHQDQATAHEQAVRGTFDPGYFAYTLGKLQILALREEAKSRLGDRFALRRFHDALLAHGSPPLALVHDAVLREMGAP